MDYGVLPGGGRYGHGFHRASRCTMPLPTMSVTTGMATVLVDKAIASAHKVSTLDIVNNRLIPTPSSRAQQMLLYDKSSDSYTLYVANQNPHVERLLMGLCARYS